MLSVMWIKENAFKIYRVCVSDDSKLERIF